MFRVYKPHRQSAIEHIVLQSEANDVSEMRLKRGFILKMEKFKRVQNLQEERPETCMEDVKRVQNTVVGEVLDVEI